VDELGISAKNPRKNRRNRIEGTGVKKADDMQFWEKGKHKARGWGERRENSGRLN